MKDLLFIVGKGHLDATNLKRAYDLLPALARHGYRSRVISYFWERLWHWRNQADLGRESYRRGLWALNAARLTPSLTAWREKFMRRILAREAARADAVIVVRTALDEDWRGIIRAKARRLIYDFDDAIWLEGDDQAVARFRTMVTLADEIVAGNNYLAGHAQQFNPNVRVIPTAVDCARYALAQRPKPSNACVIGYVGSPSTMRYLAPLAGPLAELGREREVILRVVGAGTTRLPEFRNVLVESHPQVPYDPVKFVPGFDIGVMLLEDTAWERGKCGAKMLEYMGAGVPVVCSPVGENVNIAQDGVTALFARTPDEWLAALRRLAQDAALRQKLGAAGRKRAESHYSLEVAAQLWHELIADCRLQIAD